MNDARVKHGSVSEVQPLANPMGRSTDPSVLRKMGVLCQTKNIATQGKHIYLIAAPKKWRGSLNHGPIHVSYVRPMCSEIPPAQVRNTSFSLPAFKPAA